MGYSATQLNPGAGGANVKQFTDSSGNVSQAVILQTQDSSSDPLPIGFTNPIPVQGGVADFSADIQNSVKVAGVYNASAPTASTGQRVPLQVDAAGNLKINIVAGAAAGGTSSSFNSAIPAVGTMAGASDGVNMKPILVDGSGNLKVNVAAGGVPAGQDNAAFTAGSTQGLPMMAVADNTNSVGAVTQGNQGIPKMTLGRQLLVAPQANVVGGWSPFSLLAANTNNATVIKASAGSIGYILAVNVTGTVVYLKLYNKSSVPAPATDNALLVARIPIPANTSGAGVSLPIPAGMAFSSGIGMALVANISDTDNTAVAANCATVNIGFI